MPKNRRFDFRKEEENIAFLYPLKGDSTKKKDGVLRTLTRDISIGGMRIFLDRSFNVGDSFNLELILGLSKERLQIKAQVCWLKTIEQNILYEVGLKFTELSPDDEIKLIDHIYREKKAQKN